MSEISAKQIGLNIIVIIDGEKYSKKSDATEIASIKNKILLYNKRPDSKRKQDIIRIFDKKIGEKEKKEATKKGLKKAIKKVKKEKVVKKKEDLSLVDSVVKEYKDGNLTDEEIQTLEDLLKKKKAEKEVQPVIAEKDVPTQNGSRPRESYR
jgi:hypothetical protein